MIVVTGAAGFIGSNLAHRLAETERELVLVDHPLTAAKAGNLAGLESFPLLEHTEFLQRLAAGALEPRVIFHLGACSRTTETDWSYLLDNNVEYTRTLWTWCAANRRPFIYASSAATYGDGSLGFDDAVAPHRLTPLNLYGRSKNDFDRWALDEVAAGRPAPSSWAGMKFFNVYGPRETHKTGMTSVVLNSYRQILQTGEVALFKSSDPAFPDGGQQRDFVFVQDVIDHMLGLAKLPRCAGLFNSGTGLARTFLDLACAVFAAMGKPERIHFIDMPAALIGKYQNHTQAVMTKLRALGIGTIPTSLEDGVARYVRSLAG